MAVQHADDSDIEDDDDSPQSTDKLTTTKTEDSVPVKLTGAIKNIIWIGEPIKTDTTKVYYEKVEIDGEEFSIGEFVMVETSQANIPALVSRIVYMWKDLNNPKVGFFHAEVFIRSSDTVLGEVGGKT